MQNELLVFLEFWKNPIEMFYKEDRNVADDAGGNDKLKMGQHSQLPGIKSSNLILPD